MTVGGADVVLRRKVAIRLADALGFRLCSVDRDDDPQAVGQASEAFAAVLRLVRATRSWAEAGYARSGVVIDEAVGDAWFEGLASNPLSDPPELRAMAIRLADEVAWFIERARGGSMISVILGTETTATPPVAEPQPRGRAVVIRVVAAPIAAGDEEATQLMVERVARAVASCIPFQRGY